MSDKPPAMKRNAMFSVLTNLSDTVMVVLMVVAGRKLGAEAFGELSYALSIAAVFASLSGFGMNSMVTREVARHPEQAKRYLASTLSWRLLISGSVLAAFLLWAGLWSGLPGDQALIMKIIGLSVILRFLSMSGRSILQALERFDLEMWATVTEQVVAIVGGLILLLLGFGLYALAFHLLISRMFGVLVMYLVLNQHIGINLEFDWPLIKRLQIQAIPLGIGAFIAVTYKEIDTLMIRPLMDLESVGLYNSAVKAYFALFAIPSVIRAVMMPRLSRSFIRDKHEHNHYLMRGVLLMLGVSLPIAIGGFLLGPWALTMVFGPAYADAGAPLQALMVVSIFTFQVWLLQIIMVAINRQLSWMWFSAFGLAVRLGLNILFISKFGIIGAAYAVGASEAALLVAGWIYLMRVHFQIAGPRDLVRKAWAASISPHQSL